MKAVRLQQQGSVMAPILVDIEDPGEPSEGEIRVRLEASSLNFHDLALQLGYIPSADGRIPLSDGAGVVEAVGSDVTEFKPGDIVVSTFFPGWAEGGPLPSVGNFSTTPGDGVDGYAREYIVTKAMAFTRAPKGYTAMQAATLTTAGVTAWRALVVDGQVKAGDTVLLLGTGGVSIFALQLARLMGAEVIITSSSDEKLARAKALGATHTINYHRTKEWSKSVLDLTDGKGVDHVVEVGGPGTLTQSIASTRVGGHIAMIGVLTGVNGEVPTALLLARHIRLQGLVVGSRRHQMDLVRALDNATIKPVIDKTFSLDDLGNAYAFQKRSDHFGKIGLTIDQ